MPYIIENEDDSETCILQFISRLSAEDTSEIFHAHIRREYSDVTFGNFTAKRDPQGRYTKEIEEQLKPAKKPKRYKRKAISPKVLAHVLEDYQGCALQDAVQELEERDIEVVLTTVWLPDFLVQNNLKILKWIREKEQKPKGAAYQKAKYRNMGNKEIDKEKFKEVLALITGRMWSLFNLANPNQTEHNFIHNSIIFESFINSNDRRIRRFLENPYT